MLEFIVEHIWILIIVGTVIILTAIGFIVDKFVINKDNEPKKEPKKVENDVEPVVPEVPENQIEPVVPLEQTETVQEENNANLEVANENEIPNTSEENTEEQVEESENQMSTEENVVKTEPLFSNEDESEKKESPWEV